MADKKTKRKRQMDHTECEIFAQSVVGAQSLTQPETRVTSSLDPHRGLYPRASCRNKPHYRDGPAISNSTPSNSRESTGENSEVKPAKQPKYQNNFVMSSQVLGQSPKSSPRRGTKAVPDQSNKMNNYFSSQSQPSLSNGNTQRAYPDTPTKDMSPLYQETTPSKEMYWSAPCSQTKSLQSPTSSQGSFTCSLYSPLKKLSGSIYIEDSQSPSSSQGSSSDCVIIDYQPGTSLTKAKQSKIVGQRQGQLSVKVEEAKPKNSWLYLKEFSQSPKSQKKSSVKEVSKLSDSYGLLGTGNAPEEINYFAKLPTEVLMNIFCRLPMLDLCINTRVCQQWNEIISGELFVPWKKRYHMLKKGDQVTQQFLDELVIKHDMKDSHQYMKGIIRYMKTFKRVLPRNGVVQCLLNHPCYEAAMDVIEERIQDVYEENGTTSKNPNPWSFIACLVILSESVADVQRLLMCLLGQNSGCTTNEILECLYCISTLLFYFKIKQTSGIWRRIHYYLFYAIYLHENKSVTSLGDLESTFKSNQGQQTIMKYTNSETVSQLTHEQLRIIKQEIVPGQTIKIVAFAGTGKTTTLVRYTQYRPSVKFLLVVFNKSVCEYAKTQFPPNVECKTGHSLAFNPCGRKYMGNKFAPNIKVYPVTQALPYRKGDNQYVRAKFVVDAIENFCASADEFITTAHVPSSRVEENTKTGRKLIQIDHETQMRYAEDAQEYWNHMVNMNSMKARMTHDGYLKLYQLSKPRLPQYDCILIDEAQDITPALADILLSQSQSKILVGDPHQQIYSFRGAVNAMQQVHATHLYYLTQSFRFGPEIAYIASCLLDFLKGVKRKTIVGTDREDGVQGDTKGQIAIITRTNFQLFSEAVKICAYEDKNVKVAFVGGKDGFGFDQILDIHALMLSPQDRQKEGRIIKHPLVKNFKSFRELQNYATRTMDVELLGKIKIVTTFNTQLPNLVKKIFSKCTNYLDIADIAFSTAHKAKGLEFDTVRITDDYNVVPYETLSNPDGQNLDESNLLYVAVTRAKKRLQMSTILYHTLSQMGEKFQFIKSSKKLKADCQTFVCLATDEAFEPSVLTLAKKGVTLNGGTEKKPGGVYSPVVITEDMSDFRELLGGQ